MEITTGQQPLILFEKSMESSFVADDIIISTIFQLDKRTPIKLIFSGRIELQQKKPTFFHKGIEGEIILKLVEQDAQTLVDLLGAMGFTYRDNK